MSQPTTHERQFWEDIVRAANPDWQFALDNNARAGTGTLSTLRVRVYTVDTSCLWTMAGATTENEMMRARAALLKQERHTDVISAAGECVVENGAASVEASSKEAHQAVTLALIALTGMQTFHAAKQATGSLEGHWLYLVYRLKGGGTLSRPAFLRAEEPGLLTVEDLLSFVRDIVARDTHPTSATTSVGMKLRDGGGAVLDPRITPRTSLDEEPSP